MVSPSRRQKGGRRPAYRQPAAAATEAGGLSPGDDWTYMGSRAADGRKIPDGGSGDFPLWPVPAMIGFGSRPLANFTPWSALAGGALIGAVRPDSDAWARPSRRHRRHCRRTARRPPGAALARRLHRRPGVGPDAVHRRVRRAARDRGRRQPPDDRCRRPAGRLGNPASATVVPAATASAA